MCAGPGATLDPTLRLEQSADRALDQGRWGPALRMLEQAAQRADRPSREAHLLARALDLAWTHLPRSHPDVRLLSERLLDLDPEDDHALGRFTVALVLSGEPEGVGLVDTLLGRPGVADPELWSTLAGALRERVAAGELTQQPRLLEVLWRGSVASPDLPDATPLLGFLEERAIVEGRRPDQFLQDDPRDPDLDLTQALRRALHLRAQQFDAGHDAPWPALELARGRYYLRRMADPRGPHPRHLLLADLSTGVAETWRVARASEDRVPLVQTAGTCRRLRQAGIFAPDMLLAEALLHDHLAHEAPWRALDDEPLARPAEREAARLALARSERLRVLQALVDQRAIFGASGNRTLALPEALAPTLTDPEGQSARLGRHLAALAEPEGLRSPPPETRAFLAGLARLAGEPALRAVLDAALPQGCTPAELARARSLAAP